MTQFTENPGQCPECPQILTSKNWRNHLKTHHGYAYVTLPVEDSYGRKRTYQVLAKQESKQ